MEKNVIPSLYVNTDMVRNFLMHRSRYGSHHSVKLDQVPKFWYRRKIYYLLIRILIQPRIWVRIRIRIWLWIQSFKTNPLQKTWSGSKTLLQEKNVCWFGYGYTLKKPDQNLDRTPQDSWIRIQHIDTGSVCGSNPLTGPGPGTLGLEKNVIPSLCVEDTVILDKAVFYDIRGRTWPAY